MSRATRMTLEEFLAWEEQQPERHEFVDGEVFAITRSTLNHSLNHSLLGFSLAKLLDRQLRPRGCITLPEGVKVLADLNTLYPDVVAACTRQSDPRLVQSPRLIAEVLSPATELYDRGKKWTLYQRISSLQVYLLVAQDAVEVDLFRRTTDGWHFSHHADPVDPLVRHQPRRLTHRLTVRQAAPSASDYSPSSSSSPRTRSWSRRRPGTSSRYRV